MKNFKTFTVYCNADEAVVIADVLADYQKQIKDLETANARLFERNHELQVDNEESLKEVENQYKIVAALRDDKAQLLERFDEHVEMITELRQENLDYSKRCEDLRKVVPTHAKAFIEQSKLVKQLQDRCESLNTQLDVATHTAQLLREEKSKIAAARYRDLEIIEELREHNGDLAHAGLNSPKSKFVITVEEF